MKLWSKVEIDHKYLDSCEKEQLENKSKNPACSLGNYWESRVNHEIKKHLINFGKLPYGYVGDGWPNKINQDKLKSFDKLKIAKNFHLSDLNTRDVGDAIYQANILIERLPKNKHIKILDFGGGYGRLALAFLSYFKQIGMASKITYVSIDAVPISLVIASQFVHKLTGLKCLPWNKSTKTISKYQFVSLPTWRIDSLKNDCFDLFISIHSFQEMTIEAIEYYQMWMGLQSIVGSYFYSINLWPENLNVCSNWKVVFDRGFPINRDGNYNEVLYKREV